MSRRPWVVSVADLVGRPGVPRIVEIEAELPDLAVSSAAVPPGEPVSARLTLESTGSAIVARGEVTSAFVGECRRCLQAVAGTVEAEVHEVFEPSPTEGETYPLARDEIDVEPLVREAVLLALPIAPLCAPDCGGPSPDDYRVSQVGSPDEDGPPLDPRWAALDQLRRDVDLDADR
jgi:uncharacterized protein